MRPFLYLVLFCLLAGAAGCRPAASGSDWDYVHTFSLDSMKRALQAGVFNPRAEMIALGVLGVNYYTFGQYDTARYYLNRALEMPGGREFQGGRFISNLANTYAFEGRYAEAMGHYMDALGVAERAAAAGTDSDASQGEINVIRVGANLSEILYTIGSYERALHYALRAQNLLDRDAPSARAARYIYPQVLWVLGSVWLERGELERADSAMARMFEISALVAKESVAVGDPNAGGQWWYHAYARQGQAQLALARGDTDAALSLAGEALMYARRHNDPTVTARMLAAFSDIYRARGDYEQSGLYADRALELHPEYLKLDPGALFNAGAAHLFVGDGEGAYDDFRRYAEQVRANTDKQFRETMAGMEVVYQTERQQARIAALEQQRTLYLSIALLGLGLAGTGWIIFRQRIRRERLERQLVAEEAILKWEKQERKRFAGEMHDGINGILTTVRHELNAAGSLQHICKRVDECIETIRRMARGLIPGSLERYGLKAALEDYCRLFPNVDFHFYGEERRLDERLELTVYYSAYELVNNSFRHSGAEHIDVQLMQMDDSVSLTVQDDGCGFDPSALAGSSGLQNIRNRVAALDGWIDLGTAPGEGTETTIDLSLDSGMALPGGGGSPSKEKRMGGEGLKEAIRKTVRRS